MMSRLVILRKFELKLHILRTHNDNLLYCFSDGDAIAKLANRYDDYIINSWIEKKVSEGWTVVSDELTASEYHRMGRIKEVTA